MSSPTVIATRESRLALWQAEHVRDLLRTRFGLQVELLGMTTKGDQILDRALSKVGGKGLFVKELETALEEGRAHPMCAEEGEGFVGVGVRLRTLHRAEAHGEWMGMSSFWSDQTSMGKRGLYQYEHLTENWTSGPYGRQAVPTAPMPAEATA